MVYIFKQIAKLGRAQSPPVRPDMTRKSMNWFRKVAKAVTEVDLRRMHMARSRLQGTVGAGDIGSMFHFWYDAKHKDKLPYWDRHPLIFVIGLYRDGFLGINLHYISPTQRARLMNALYTQAEYDSDGRPTRLDISYGILSGLARAEAFRPCVKRYLFGQLKSPLLRINSDEWDMALMLPTQVWVSRKGHSTHSIYRKSARSFA